MLVLIHGDNQVLSRERLQSQIATYKSGLDLHQLDGKKISLEDLLSACESPLMFTEPRLIVIESLHAQTSKTKLAQLVNYLASLQTNQVDLILWEGKLLTPSQLAPFKQFQIIPFKTSNLTFKFLDSLKPGETSRYLTLYKQAIQADTPEFVFYMLIRQLRLMSQSASPESSRLPGWQVGKLKSQLSSFTPTQFTQLHDALYDLDFRQKSGGTTFTLAAELELILSTFADLG